MELAESGSLSPHSGKAPCGRRRPHPASNLPALSSTFGENHAASVSEPVPREKSDPHSAPELLDCQSDPWFGEECSSGRGVRSLPMGAGSWGHVRSLLVSCQILNPLSQEFAVVSSETLKVL